MLDRCSNGINCCGAPPNEYDLDVSGTQSVGQKRYSGSTNLNHVDEVNLLTHLLPFPLCLKLSGSHLVPVELDPI